MRIACLRIPDFPVWAFRRHDPSLAGLPLVVGGLPPERKPILALSDEARARGLRAGQTLSQAQAIFPEARFLRPDPGLEGRERRFLLNELDRFTPRVEMSPPAPHGLYFLDTGGLGRHHATEQAFAERLARHLLGLGYPAHVGLASSKLVAQVASHESASVHVVPAGTERSFLAPLPLARLPFPQELVVELLALGLRTIGDWAALPSEAVASRFGSLGLGLQSLARGDDPTPFTPSSDTSEPPLTIELDEPLGDLEGLIFHLKQAVDRLTRALAARGLAAAGLALRLELEDHGHSTHEVRLLRPTLAPRLLLDCLRLTLGRELFQGQTGGRVRGFSLAPLESAPARAEQLLLFTRRQAALDAGAVEAALERVRALVGPDAVVSPRPADAQRPEEQVAWEPYPGLHAASTPPPRELPRVHPQADPPPGPALRGLPARLLPSPLAARVELRAGRPAHLEATGLHLSGRVAALDGPHTLEGEWWGNPCEREYYILALAGGARCWVFRDLREDRWYLHGLFD